MPTPLILAVDAATQTGFCLGRPGQSPEFGTVNFGDSGDSHLEVGAQALKWIAHLLTDRRPDQLWIEEPLGFESKQGQTTGMTRVRLNGLWMVIGSAARLKGVPVHPVTVSSARKPFLGHGRLKRHEAKKRARAMCRLLGWEPRNDDEADAGAIWWFACVANAPELAPKISKLMHAKSATIVGRPPFGVAGMPA